MREAKPFCVEYPMRLTSQFDTVKITLYCDWLYIHPFCAVKYGMIVAKFGGTAVTPRNLIYLKRIVTEHHLAVVVSAVGREYKDDVKATDLLLQYHESRDQQAWEFIADKYRRLAEVNGIAVDVDAMLSDARSRAALYDRDYCASLGEELSARIVAAFLDADYVEAERVVRFANGDLDAEQTFSNVRAAFCDGKRHVMGGFYGGCDGGRRTFSRGGGDVTGAIVAAALDASLYENWTDVNGVCVADPASVHNVSTVLSMSYAEMRMLSLAGAEVLHPDAVTPCETRGIPIKIGNFFHPQSASTLISFCPSVDKLLSVAEKISDSCVETTALHSYPMWQVLQRVSGFARSYTRELNISDRRYTVEPQINIEFRDKVVRVRSSESVLVPLYRALI